MIHVTIRLKFTPDRGGDLDTGDRYKNQTDRHGDSTFNITITDYRELGLDRFGGCMVERPPRGRKIVG